MGEKLKISDTEPSFPTTSAAPAAGDPKPRPLIDPAWHSLFRYSPAALSTNDLDGRFLSANPSFLKLIGYELEEILSLHAFEITPEQDRPDCLRKIQELLIGAADFFETEKGMICKDGTILTVRLSVSLVKDETGRPLHLMALTEDITQRLETERSFKAAREAAEIANATKSAFLANMSHEIRTPLSAIVGYSSLLRDERRDEAERQVFLDTVLRNGHMLMHLIDDILDLSKVEADRLVIEKLPLAFPDLIEEVMTVFHYKAAEKGITLRLEMASDVPDTIQSDPTRLRQILMNVIGNAVKFTEEGEVRVEVAREAGDRSDEEGVLTITVADTGIGLDAEQQARLFLPFSQADNSTTRRFGGTGLGLHLARRLAQAMAGDLALRESRIGRGSTFDFRFRYESASKSREAPTCDASAPTTIDLGGRTILVAEDSPDNQFLIVSLLESQGAKVVTANNGKEALDCLTRHDFDLVLMDIQMPIMDGYEATGRMRSLGFRPPILALTAHAMMDERRRSIEAGCDLHLTKPLNPVELFRAFHQLGLARSPSSQFA